MEKLLSFLFKFEIIFFYAFMSQSINYLFDIFWNENKIISTSTNGCSNFI